MRIRVGRFVALAYLFCVLAPAAALAWGSGPAPCLGDDLQTVALAHQHGESHMHADGGHDHAAAHAHHQTAAQDAPARHHHDGKGAPGPCCAMMCASALPAALPDVAKPVQPTSACAPEIAVSLHSEAPPLLYRPPIA
ncbi:hypothetical protein [Bradyrhizobium iriomotense]|uniref:Cobalt transporter n=1 Tax=Bradyrhizobium iriomotense TaxID=441950 RepID=A0ABQ6B4K5_9BRAD|nr:hypothetical protein [Bradyrhizobium iriomotense]GLR88396.1 hypothetical protein GCM10007857_51080 [Bradyrhizobium iriomotense]